MRKILAGALLAAVVLPAPAHAHVDFCVWLGSQPPYPVPGTVCAPIVYCHPICRIVDIHYHH